MLALTALLGLACGAPSRHPDSLDLDATAPGLTIRVRHDLPDGTPGEIALSPDGARIAVAASGDVRILRASDGAALHSFDIANAESLRWSPDGTRLAFQGSSDGVFRLHDVATGEERWSWSCGRACRSGAAFSPDGASFALLDDQNHLQLIDAGTGELRAQIGLPVNTIELHHVSYAPDGRSLLLGGGITVPMLRVDLRTGDVQPVPPGHDGDHIGPRHGHVLDEPLIPAQDLGWQLLIHDLSKNEPPRALQGCGYLGDVVFTPDERHLLVGSMHGSAQLFDLASAAEIGALPGYPCDVWPPQRTLASFTTDGRTLAIARRSTLTLYDVGAPLAPVGALIRGCDGPCPVPPSVERAPVRRGQGDAALTPVPGERHGVFARSHHGPNLAIATPDAIEVWDPELQLRLRRLAGAGAPVSAIGWSFAGDRVVVATSDGRIQSRDPLTGHTLLEAAGPAAPLAVGAVDDDIVVVYPDGIRRVGSAGSSLVWTAPEPLRDAAISPDGRWVAVSAGQVASVIDVQAGAVAWTLPEPHARGLAWSWTGEVLVVGLTGGRLAKRSGATGAGDDVAPRLPGEVRAIAFDRDDKKLAVLVDVDGGTRGYVVSAMSFTTRATFDPSCAGDACASLGWGGRRVAIGQGAVTLYDVAVR